MKSLYDKDTEKYDSILKALRTRIEEGIEEEYLPIKNDSFEHAKVLFRHFIEASKKEILIFTTTLCKNFYLDETILAAFQDKNDGEISIKILVSDGDKNNIQEVCRRIQEANNHISIEAKEGEITVDGERINDFSLVDNTIYRYEKEQKIEIECKEREEIKALASFNDDESARFLRDLFEDKFNSINSAVFP